MAKLSVRICGIEFPNPVMTAAGPGAKDGLMCKAAAMGGAGGIVTKTISVTPAEIPLPCMAEIQGGFLNTELWSEKAKEEWLEHDYTLIKETGLPVIIGLGYTAGQIAQLAPLVKPYADALEISSHYVGNDISPIVATLQAAKAAVDVPVFMKLSPHPNIREIAQAVEAAGADGLVMINSFGPCMAIDVETGLPVMGSETGYGWLSGPAIKPLAVRCIYDAAGVVKIPIIGVGGVATGRDAAEMLMAGASAVQVCTAAILKGPGVYGTITKELGAFLDRHGYTDIAQIKGLTHRKMAERVLCSHTNNPVAKPSVDSTVCNLCGLCEASCVYGAISRHGKLAIAADKCFGCGLCISRCPKKALKLL